MEEGVVRLQAPGDEALEYPLVDESTEDLASVVLVRQDESEEEIQFFYGHEIDEVCITAEGAELGVMIVDQKRIVVINEEIECPWEDCGCISEAVNEGLIDFEDEDLVAILAATAMATAI